MCLICVEYLFNGMTIEEVEFAMIEQTSEIVEEEHQSPEVEEIIRESFVD